MTGNGKVVIKKVDLIKRARKYTDLRPKYLKMMKIVKNIKKIPRNIKKYQKMMIFDV